MPEESVLEVRIGGVERRCCYLREIRVPIWVRNTCAFPVQIVEASLVLTPDSGVSVGTALCSWRVSSPLTRLDAGAREVIYISGRPDLFFLPNSNQFDVVIDYAVIHEGGIGPRVTHRSHGFDYLIVEELPTPEPAAQVFVSFIDPENDDLSWVAEEYLRRAGFRPYRAKQDPKTGYKNWEGKIFPAIDSSIALLAIWTDDATRRPENVMREIDYAADHGVGVGVFLAQGLTPPTRFPKDVFEFQSFNPVAPHVGFAMAIAASARRFLRGEPFFGNDSDPSG